MFLHFPFFISREKKMLDSVSLVCDNHVNSNSPNQLIDEDGVNIIERVSIKDLFCFYSICLNIYIILLSAVLDLRMYCLEGHIQQILQGTKFSDIITFQNCGYKYRKYNSPDNMN